MFYLTTGYLRILQPPDGTPNGFLRRNLRCLRNRRLFPRPVHSLWNLDRGIIDVHRTACDYRRSRWYWDLCFCGIGA